MLRRGRNRGDGLPARAPGYIIILFLSDAIAIPDEGCSMPIAPQNQSLNIADWGVRFRYHMNG